MTGAAIRIGVVYLARSVDGLDAFRRFAASYAAHPAGIEHELVVLFKGFAGAAEREEAGAIFSGAPHRALDVADTGFDIGSYVEASERLDHDALCFLNTHSEILADGWLAALNLHFSRDDVGLVGCMGSYESLQQTVTLLQRAIDAARRPFARRSEPFIRYFDFLLPRYRPEWYGAGQGPKLRLNDMSGIVSYAKVELARARLPGTGPRGTALIWPGAPELDTRDFPSFPNPHVRSNAFMISRAQLLAADLTVMRTKADANLFESGRNSLTTQIRRSGAATIVVGRGGAGYDMAEWSRSETFRLGDQVHLLVGDNHTRAFAAMSPGAKIAHERMTWGDYRLAPPADFPAFGVTFPIGALALGTPEPRQTPPDPAPPSDAPSDMETFMALLSATAPSGPLMSTEHLPVRPWLVVFRDGQAFSMAVDEIDRFPFENGDQLAVEPAALMPRWFRTPEHHIHIPIGPGIGVRVPPVMKLVEFKGYIMPEHLVNLTGAGIGSFDELGRAHLHNYGQVMPLRSDMSFLEIGSGAGRDALQLTEIIGPEGHYYGIDVQRESIVWCQKNITRKHPHFTFHHFNAEHELHNPLATKTTLDFPLPAPDGTVDFVALGSVFTHLFETEVRYYLKEIARVLKPGGLCYATFFLYAEEVVEASRRNNLTPYGLTFAFPHGDGCHISNPDYPTGSVAFTEAKMSEMIADAGLVLDQPYIMGAWSGFYPVQHINDGQDVAVLRRKDV